VARNEWIQEATVQSLIDDVAFFVFYCARHLSKLTSVVSVIFLFRAPPQRGDISLDW
jgi:hypothetical protein